MRGSSRTVVTAMVVVVLGIAGLSYVLARTITPVAAQPGGHGPFVEYTSDGKRKQPVGYREWVYIGTPLTPNELNDGHAAFPEFHAAYIDPEVAAYCLRSGECRCLRNPRLASFVAVG